MACRNKDKVGAAGLAALWLGLCLLTGCAPQQPVLSLYMDAVALRELGQDRLAIEKLDELIKADPDFKPAYSELGKACRKVGDNEKALAAFRQAAKLEPWSFENQANLARTYESLEKYSPAADAYGRAVELDPNNVDVLVDAAKCSVKAGQFTQAQAYCERAGADRSVELLPVLAQAYEGQKDYVRAIDVYERMLTQDDPDPNVLVSLGVACVKAERYDRGRDVLLAATQKRPDDGTAYRHLGFCFVKFGDMDQAMQAYQKSIDLNGNDWEAYRGLGTVCVFKADQTGDERWRVQGVRHWRQSLVINPDQPRRQVLEKLIRENAREQNPPQGLND
ncbi:MAG: tetratricopeptide repeat protein [Solirubrobacterales bacterium]